MLEEEGRERRELGNEGGRERDWVSKVEVIERGKERREVERIGWFRRKREKIVGGRRSNGVDGKNMRIVRIEFGEKMMKRIERKEIEKDVGKREKDWKVLIRIERWEKGKVEKMKEKLGVEKGERILSIGGKRKDKVGGMWKGIEMSEDVKEEDRNIGNNVELVWKEKEKEIEIEKNVERWIEEIERKKEEVKREKERRRGVKKGEEVKVVIDREEVMREFGGGWKKRKEVLEGERKMKDDNKRKLGIGKKVKEGVYEGRKMEKSLRNDKKILVIVKKLRMLEDKGEREMENEMEIEDKGVKEWGIDERIGKDYEKRIRVLNKLNSRIEKIGWEEKWRIERGEIMEEIDIGGEERSNKEIKRIDLLKRRKIEWKREDILRRGWGKIGGNGRKGLRKGGGKKKEIIEEIRKVEEMGEKEIKDEKGIVRNKIIVKMLVEERNDENKLKEKGVKEDVGKERINKVDGLGIVKLKRKRMERIRKRGKRKKREKINEVEMKLRSNGELEIGGDLGVLEEEDEEKLRNERKLSSEEEEESEVNEESNKSIEEREDIFVLKRKIVLKEEREISEERNWMIMKVEIEEMIEDREIKRVVDEKELNKELEGIIENRSIGEDLRWLEIREGKKIEKENGEGWRRIRREEIKLKKENKEV